VRPIHNDPRAKRATFPEVLPLFAWVGEHEEAAMHITKIRSADANGLVPAGAYFAQLATNLSAANARDAAVNEMDEARERKLEARYRRAKSPPPARGACDQLAIM
jgi:hypothetical protein